MSLMEKAEEYINTLPRVGPGGKASQEQIDYWTQVAHKMREARTRQDRMGRGMPMTWLSIARWICEQDPVARRHYTPISLASILSRRDRVLSGRPVQTGRTRRRRLAKAAAQSEDSHLVPS